MMTQPNRSQTIRIALTPFVENGLLAGIVALVAEKDEVLSLVALGYEDLAIRKPMQADTLFWVASQTKPITATALMLLVDAGQVGLDDPLTKFLPDFEDQWLIVEQDDEHLLLRKPQRAVTVRNLLSHTSGMAFKSMLEEPTLDRSSLKDGVRGYLVTPLLSEPDTRFYYSNIGINLIGRIIEIVSGLPYAAFLQERLLKPLEMTDTTFWPTPEQLGRLAKSYRPNPENTSLEAMQIAQLQYPLDDPRRQPIPGGGLFSTAVDMMRFCQMILRGGVIGSQRLISEAAIAEMTRKQTGDTIPDGYGLGWSVGSNKYGHSGAHATNMSVHSDADLITVYLIQQHGFLEGGEQGLAAFESAALGRQI